MRKAAGRLTTEGQNLIDNLEVKIESANEDMDVKPYRRGHDENGRSARSDRRK